MGKDKTKKAAAPEAAPKAAAVPKPAAAPPSAVWARIVKGGWNTTADSREVDVASVESMLAERMAAKAGKNYAKADKIAADLQEMNIAYLDDKRE